MKSESNPCEYGFVISAGKFFFFVTTKPRVKFTFWSCLYCLPFWASIFCSSTERALFRDLWCRQCSPVRCARLSLLSSVHCVCSIPAQFCQRWADNSRLNAVPMLRVEILMVSNLSGFPLRRLQLFNFLK